MRYNFSILVLFIFLLSGCATQPTMPKGGLMVLTADAGKQWNIPNQLMEEGDGNSHRILSSQTQGNNILELVAGSQGHIEYFVEEQADITAFAQIQLQFLSTQGKGLIKVSALDGEGKTIGETGFVFTGALPQANVWSRWYDARYRTNYQGDWLEKRYNLAEMLAGLPQESLAGARKYRLSVEIDQGQHVLISKFEIGKDHTKAVQLIPNTRRYTANQGDVLFIEADAQNVSNQVVNNVVVKLIEPYGYGLVIASQNDQRIDQLAPGERRHVSWQVQVQRPDAVNLNKPWNLKFKVNGVEMPDQVQVAAMDTRPGKVFYVMTEDLEPIDGAGYAQAWGNSNSWLDPQEFLGQMVHKAEALNRVADKYGAKWTHYIAWPAVKAGQWAANQSQTGQWPKVVSAIQGSVVQESERGHEYGLHLHSDYDPDLPGNVLSYNGVVDGLWGNHLKHGWAHSVKTEGDFNQYASRTGMLYDYQRSLEQLASGSAQGQLLTARVGSFDFGSGKQDEAMSTSAYKKVGLWGSSDADGNNGKGLASGNYGNEIYFAAPDDINVPAVDLNKLGIVEFRPTPIEPIAYDSQNAAVMNGKTDQGMEYFTAQGTSVKPGIHAVIGFTHAMFVTGQSDWQSTEGGQFQVIDDHLAYVKNKYVDKGLLSFATASELVEAYLDYYTPQLLAVFGKRILQQEGDTSEYEIRILGRDIVVDSDHSHIVNVKCPLYLRDNAYRVCVLKDDEMIYTAWGVPTPFNDIPFVVDDKQAVYTLHVHHNEFIYNMMLQWYALKEIIFTKF